MTSRCNLKCKVFSILVGNIHLLETSRHLSISLLAVCTQMNHYKKSMFSVPWMMSFHPYKWFKIFSFSNVMSSSTTYTGMALADVSSLFRNISVEFDSKLYMESCIRLKRNISLNLKPIWSFESNSINSVNHWNHYFTTLRINNVSLKFCPSWLSMNFCHYRICLKVVGGGIIVLSELSERMWNHCSHCSIVMLMVGNVY